MGLRNGSSVANKLLTQLMQAHPELQKVSPVLAEALN